MIKTKKCPTCNKIKNITEFHKDSGKKDGLYYRCKECVNKKRRKYYKLNREKKRKDSRNYYHENKDKIKPRTRIYHLKYYFNISIEDYNKMFEEQQGRCAICGKHVSEFKSNLAVDHCHKSGKIRGLLCVSCNTKLSWFEQYQELILGYLNNV